MKTKVRALVTMKYIGKVGSKDGDDFSSYLVWTCLGK